MLKKKIDNKIFYTIIIILVLIVSGIAYSLWTEKSILTLPEQIFYSYFVKLKNPNIVIYKEKRELALCDGDKKIKTFKIGLGREPVGDKTKRGDSKTPVGDYYICIKPDKSNYYLSLGLSYPNIKDAENGLKNNIIDENTYQKIVRSIRNQERPPWDTPLGSHIMIHGGGAARDWTDGCIGVDNYVMDILWSHCKIGTTVTILP